MLKIWKLVKVAEWCVRRVSEFGSLSWFRSWARCNNWPDCRRKYRWWEVARGWARWHESANGCVVPACPSCGGGVMLPNGLLGKVPEGVMDVWDDRWIREALRDNTGHPDGLNGFVNEIVFEDEDMGVSMVELDLRLRMTLEEYQKRKATPGGCMWVTNWSES